MTVLFDRYFYPSDQGELRPIKLGLTGDSGNLSLKCENLKVGPKLRGLGEWLFDQDRIDATAWHKSEVALTVPVISMCGQSMTLAAALAYIHGLNGRDEARPRRIVVATGDLTQSSELAGWGTLTPVDELAEKINGIIRESDGMLNGEDRHFVYCSQEDTPEIREKLSQLDRLGWKLHPVTHFDELVEFWGKPKPESTGQPVEDAGNGRWFWPIAFGGFAASFMVALTLHNFAVQAPSDQGAHTPLIEVPDRQLVELEAEDPTPGAPLRFDGTLRVDVAEEKPDGDLRAWVADGKRFASSARLRLRLNYSGKARQAVIILAERSENGIRAVASFILTDNESFVRRQASDLSQADGAILVFAAECQSDDCKTERAELLSLDNSAEPLRGSLSTTLRTAESPSPLVASLPITIL